MIKVVPINWTRSRNLMMLQSIQTAGFTASFGRARAAPKCAMLGSIINVTSPVDPDDIPDIGDALCGDSHFASVPTAFFLSYFSLCV